jgi:hypothetical protein
VDAVIAEEQRIFDMIDETDTRARLDVRASDLHDLSADQVRAIVAIAASPYLVQPLQAPAGAGKTHSLTRFFTGHERCCVPSIVRSTLIATLSVWPVEPRNTQEAM